MLAKFTVSNFKSFNSEFVFDLEQTKRYEFNVDSVKNGIVNNGLVYGHNGVGKSNLGLAIFDIIHHLTDFSSGNKLYKNYKNSDSTDSLSIFKYKFVFGEATVNYTYKKKYDRTVQFEELKINGDIIARIDRAISSEAEINLVGAETLNRLLTNKNLSLLKYIKNNSQLEENAQNKVLLQFYSFIDGMLFFRCLDNNNYIGNEIGNRNIQADIIERGNVKNLQTFLNEAGIACKLSFVSDSSEKKIFFDFKNGSLPFFEVASTGTRSLTLFYFWLQRLITPSNVKFLFIDEFDAFFNHKVSYAIIEQLKRTDLQFILTTHNTSVITNSLLRPDCYFLMHKTNIKPLAERTHKELREAHNIEKMYKAGSFNV